MQADTLQHQSDLGNALHIGARYGFDRVVHALLQNKPPASSYLPLIEERDVGDFTALGLAVTHLHPAAVQVLLEAGANINTQVLLWLPCCY
jgi:ankyrin repeat protein